MTIDGERMFSGGEDNIVFRDGCKLFCMICSSKQVESGRQPMGIKLDQGRGVSVGGINQTGIKRDRPL